MNREQRRSLMRNNNSKSNMSTRTNTNTNTNTNTDALAMISGTISSKIKARLSSIRNDPKFGDLKHVQVNYFNIAKLGMKYQRLTNTPIGMSYGDVVVTNTQTGPDQPENYLCVNVFFDEEPINTELFQMMLGLTSKLHNWQYSKADDIYIDTLGVYVDRVDFEKQTEGVDNDAS